MIMNKYSILFYLNQDLLLVQLKPDSDLDKNSTTYTKNILSRLEIIADLQPDPTLNLAARLELFWAKHWLEIKSAEQILFWVGPNASFTDTRMLYLWLKTWADGIGINRNKNINIPKLKIWNCKQLENDKPFIQQFKNLLPEAELNYRDTLIYSQEPRIGRK